MSQGLKSNRKQGAWLIVIVIMILIFSFWLFSFKKNLGQIGKEGGDWQQIKENFSKIGNSFDEFKTNLEKIKQKLPQPKEGEKTLSEEEIEKLKEKIQEYAKTRGAENK